jgi:uncharacterized protein (TIGR00369 family)
MTQTQVADRATAPTHPHDRTRTISWADPAILASASPRSGLDFLRAISAGELPAPPVTHLLGFARIVPDFGRVLVEMQPQEFHYNPLGTVHGGILATVLDTATGCAVHSTLSAGEGYTSLDLTTKFLRPVTTGSGLLRCEGTVLSRGRRTALAEARLTDGAGRLVAHATSSCLIFPLDDRTPPAVDAGR